MSLFLALLLPAHAGHRYALVIGSNQGDAADPPLAFAEEDARRVAEVLQDLGQVPPDAVASLYHPDANRVRSTLMNLASRTQQDQEKDLRAVFARLAKGEEPVLFALRHDELLLNPYATHGQNT